jgi:hypothetical protein
MIKNVQKYDCNRKTGKMGTDKARKTTKGRITATLGLA